MNHIAVIRLTIYIVITVCVGIIIFFEPSLNIGTPHVVSMYEAIFHYDQPVGPLLTKLFIMVVAIFCAQLFLIGLTPKDKSKKKPKKRKKS